MKSAARIFKILLVVIVSVGLVLIIAWRTISSYAEKAITEKLKNANVSFESVSIDLLNESARFTKLHWESPTDSAHHAPHLVRAENVFISGIGILSYLINKELTISRMEMEHGDISITENLNVKKEENSFLVIREISIDQFIGKDIQAQFVFDSIPEYSAKIEFTLDNIQLYNFSQADMGYKIKSIEALAEQVVIHKKESLYTTKISKFHVNTDQGIIEVDSLNMNPVKGKYEFANSLGKQKTRIVLQIPKIAVTGFDYELVKDSIFSASFVDISSANLSVFRDKRLPFKNPIVPLPMHMLKDISFGIKMDSIVIRDSKIVHEEIAEEGSEIGKS